MHTLPAQASRYRIIPASAPGITPQYAPDGKRQPFDGTMFAQRLYGILATSWRETAGRGRQRGNTPLIKAYGQDEYPRYGLTYLMKETTHRLLDFYTSHN